MELKKPDIILVDDHDLFRDGIKTMLELNNIGNVVAEASDGKQFLELLETHKPDIVLMDIDMPVMNGVDATKKGVLKFPELKILVLSMFGDQQYYHQMIEAGAKGFILKTANKSELIEAVQSVQKGTHYFSNELLQEIVNKKSLSGKSGKQEVRIKFNTKEKEILTYMLQGFSTEEIADKVFLTTKTVSNYRTLMLDKTGCKNSISLVIYAVKNNVVQI